MILPLRIPAARRGFIRGGVGGLDRSVPPGANALYLEEVSIFFELFNPGSGHRTEELRRLENTREDEAQGAPGRGPIDLNSGTVLIRMPTKQPEDAAAEDPVLEDAVPEGFLPAADRVDAVDGEAASWNDGEAASWNDGDAAASEEDGGV